MGKSREALPQPGSHGWAIPRRSSHFGDRGASLLSRRLIRIRRLVKVPKRRDTIANLAFAKLNLPSYGGGARLNDVVALRYISSICIYMLDAKGYYLLAWTVLAVDAGRGSVLRKPHSVVKTTFKRICLLIVYYSN